MILEHIIQLAPKGMAIVAKARARTSSLGRLMRHQITCIMIPRMVVPKTRAKIVRVIDKK